MKIVESLNFKVKTYKEIFLTHLEDSYEMGLLSSDKNFLDYVKNREDIENNYIMQSSVHSNTLATAYKDMNLIYNALNIDNSEGENAAAEETAAEIDGHSNEIVTTAEELQAFYIVKSILCDVLIVFSSFC